MSEENLCSLYVHPYKYTDITVGGKNPVILANLVNVFCYTGYYEASILPFVLVTISKTGAEYLLSNLEKYKGLLQKLFPEETIIMFRGNYPRVSEVENVASMLEDFLNLLRRGSGPGARGTLFVHRILLDEELIEKYVKNGYKILDTLFRLRNELESIGLTRYAEIIKEFTSLMAGEQKIYVLEIGGITTSPQEQFLHDFVRVIGSTAGDIAGISSMEEVFSLDRKTLEVLAQVFDTTVDDLLELGKHRINIIFGWYDLNRINIKKETIAERLLKFWMERYKAWRYTVLRRFYVRLAPVIETFYDYLPIFRYLIQRAGPRIASILAEIILEIERLGEWLENILYDDFSFLIIINPEYLGFPHGMLIAMAPVPA